MEHANRMGKTCVGSARKHELRKPKLFNPTKALEWPSFDNSPKHPLKFLVSKFDEIVQRITDALRFLDVGHSDPNVLKTQLYIANNIHHANQHIAFR